MDKRGIMKINDKIKEFYQKGIIKPLIYLGIVTLLFFFEKHIFPGQPGIFEGLIKGVMETPIEALVGVSIFLGIFLLPFGIVYLILKSIEIAIMTILSVSEAHAKRDLSYLKKLAADYWKWTVVIVIVIGMRLINPTTAIAAFVIIDAVGAYAVYGLISMLTDPTIPCKSQFDEKFDSASIGLKNHSTQIMRKMEEKDELRKRSQE